MSFRDEFGACIVDKGGSKKFLAQGPCHNNIICYTTFVHGARLVWNKIFNKFEFRGKIFEIGENGRIGSCCDEGLLNVVIK